MSSDERLGAERKDSANSSVVCFDPFAFDTNACRLSRDGVEVHLTPKAAAVLCYLLENPGELISKDEFLETIWPDVHVREESLTQAISVIRQMLGDSAQSPRYIQTMSGEGYRFIGDISRSRPVPSSSAGGGSPTLPSEASGSLQKKAHRDTRSWLRDRGLPVAAATVLATLAVAAVWVNFTDDTAGVAEAETDPPEMVPLTFDGGLKRNPVLSPDGRFVAYDWAGPEGDNRDIYVLQIRRSTAAMRITTHPATDLHATWSPNSDEIAFLRVVDNRATIYRASVPTRDRESKVIEVEGPRSLADQEAFSTLDWSPDGRHIAYGERPTAAEPARIMWVDVATNETARLIEPPTAAGDGIIGDTRPRFSPDGSLLAFVRSTASLGGTDLWIANLEDGGQPWRLTSEAWRHVHKPSWTDDGQELLFSAGSAQWEQTYRVSVAGEDRGALRLVEGLSENDWAPDAAAGRLVFENVSSGPRNIYEAPGRLAEDSGLAPRPLIESPGLDQNQDFSPDGNHIVFRTTRRGRSEIWTAHRDGTGQMPLGNIVFDAYAPQWSPDGEQVLFFGISPDASDHDVYVIDVATGKARRLTTHPASDLGPTYSRDGTWVYFGSNRSGQWQIYKMSARDGEQAQPAVAVTRGGGYYGIEGPDGHLYYAVSNRPESVWRVPVGGGEEVEFLYGPVLNFDGYGPILNFNDFDVAEEGIYYGLQAGRRTSSSGSFRVMYFDFGSQKTHEVFRQDGWFVWLRVSPDEKTVTYNTNSRPRTSELVLVRSFR